MKFENQLANEEDDDTSLLRMLLRDQEEMRIHHRREMREQKEEVNQLREELAAALRKMDSTTSRISSTSRNLVNDAENNFSNDLGSFFQDEDEQPYPHGMRSNSETRLKATSSEGRKEADGWFYDLGKPITNEQLLEIRMKRKSDLSTIGENKDTIIGSFPLVPSHKSIERDYEEFLELKRSFLKMEEDITGLKRGDSSRRKSDNTQSIFTNYTQLSSAYEEGTDIIIQDTFSMMMISGINSRSWLLGNISFSFQIILASLIAVNQFNASKGTSLFDVPFTVGITINVGQFLSLFLCLSIQSDILTSVRCLLLLDKDSNWDEVIGEKGNRSYILWMIRIGYPNILKLLQGIMVVIVSFVVIVQSSDIIVLLKDFTALMIISQFDNILYELAVLGYLGEKIRIEAVVIQKANDTLNTQITERRRGRGLFFVRMVFFVLVLTMYGSWGVVVANQRNGTYFMQKYPDCGDENYKLALKNFGDGECYGGPLNSPGCKFEDGDCVNFLLAYPLCKGQGLEGLVNVEDEVGNGSCNVTFSIPECEYDGGDCCPYNIQRSGIFRNGQCNGGEIGSVECGRDGGDCLDFIEAYPNCTLSEGRNDIILGNNICEGGQLSKAQCGYEYGDCDIGQIGGDIILRGVVNPNNELFFRIQASSDGSTWLLGMPFTEDSTFNKNSRGRVRGLQYNSTTMNSKNIIDRMGNNTGDGFGTSVAMNSKGNIIAIGSTFRSNRRGRVDILQYNITSSDWDQMGQTLFLGKNYLLETFFGYIIDMTSDGLRLAISAPGSYRYDLNAILFRSGLIQVYQFDATEKSWRQLGSNIYGEQFGESIGSTALRLNSDGGSRLIFNTGTLNCVDDYVKCGGDIIALRVYDFNGSSKEWLQIGTDISTPFANLGQLVMNSSGSRIAFPTNSTSQSYRGGVYIYDLVLPESPLFFSGNIWKQLGPVIQSSFSTDEDAGGDGFGYSLSMSLDGMLLAISAIDQKCDPLTCATGSVKVYRYNESNSPSNPFALLPLRHDTSLRSVMEESERGRKEDIFGLDLSMSGDGKILGISGYDLTVGQAFVKAYNLYDVFYMECFVPYPKLINNGVCQDEEPFYTEECEFDGGDCSVPDLVDGFENCYVFNHDEISNTKCKDRLPYNTEQCNFDGGYCKEHSLVDGYTNCFVSRPSIVGDGVCDDYPPYNSFDCRFDGGDCLPTGFDNTFTPSGLPRSVSSIPSSSPTKSRRPSLSPIPTGGPTVSTMPTTTKMLEVYLEILTDFWPCETMWKLVNSNTGIMVASGPEGIGSSCYEENTLYNFTWTLNECSSYTFTIFDAYNYITPPGYFLISANGKVLFDRKMGKWIREFSVDIDISAQYEC